MNISATERDAIIKKNMDLPKIWARKYAHLMNYDDLISAGHEGLVEGADHYKPGKGASPRTHCSSWVKARVLGALYENRDVHVPWNKINAKIGFNKGKNEDVAIPFEASFDRTSGTTSDEVDRGNTLMWHAVKGSSCEHADTELKDFIARSIATADLTEIEETSVARYYGIGFEQAATLEQIASLTGYSTMGIKKARDRGLVKIRMSPAFAEAFESME